MKKIGELISSSRSQQGISIKDLSRETRIKPETLEAIENENWQVLPELPILIGFVKNIADVLSMNREQVAAILRRDYQPKKEEEPRKTHFFDKLIIGPRFIVVLFITFLSLILGAYLVYQYHIFKSPPKLTVIAPQDQEKIVGTVLNVRGTTDANATIRVNNQPAEVDRDGNFTTQIDVVPETHDIEIRAISRSGLVSTIHRTIEVIKK